MVSSTRFVLLAFMCCRAAGMTLLKPKSGSPRQKSKALVVTMVHPDDQTPVDIMMEHHIRMISGNMSTVEAAIIDNRPPWTEDVSTQDPLLARYRRSQGTTGVVKVKSVDYSRMSALMSRFFNAGELELNINVKNLALAQNIHKNLAMAEDAPTNVSKLDVKAKAARLLGMLNFLELCADADAEVDLCVFVDSTTFLYRENETGLVEVATKLFQRDPNAVVLQPPDMCTYQRTTKRGACKVGEHETKINHGFFVINRDRFEGFAPMPVESANLGSSFEELLAEGLTKGDVEGAVKSIKCGNTFFIHPYDESLGKYACPQQQLFGLQAHARAIPSARHAQALPHGHFESDYARFAGKAENAAALMSLIKRIEDGKFPEPKYPESVTNKCTNMCPSKQRIASGLAW